MKWGEADTALLRKLYARGMLYKAMCKYFPGRSEDSIGARARQLGLRRYISLEEIRQRFLALHEQGLNDTEKARELGCSRENARRIRIELGLPSIAGWGGKRR